MTVKLRKEYRIESHVKDDVKKLLNHHNYFWWMPPANGFGKVGTSDFNALRDGVFLAVETKFGGNKPTTNQKMFLQSVSAENGFGFVVDDKNIGQFARWLELFDQAILCTAEGRKIPDEVGADLLDVARVLTEMLLLNPVK